MQDRTSELTAREREVLELIRAGLTNDEIAERLGITSDGVKYHVSQLLSRLGVSSRHDAVDAAFVERRRRWWETALASTALRIAAAVSALVVVVFVLVLVFGVLKSGGSDGTDVSGLTVESVVASVSQAATRPGQVLHTRITATRTNASVTGPYYTVELWTDAANETVRREYKLDPSVNQYDLATESTGILAGRYNYVQDGTKAYRYDARPDPSGQTVCAGITAFWMAALFNCGAVTGPDPSGPPRLETGDFHGRSAVVIAYGDLGLASDTAPPTPATVTPPRGLTTVTPGAYHSRWRIYLDAAGYLPIGATFEVSEGDAPLVSIEATYANEFLPLDSDIQTLLDPHSIGYGAADADPLLDQVATKVPVYWLGKEFAGTNGLGDLVLDRVLVGPQQGGVQQNYAVGGELHYVAPDRYPDLRLFLWRKTAWDAFLQTTEGRTITDPQCGQSVQLDVSGATATAYLFSPLQFPDTGQTPIAVPIGATPPVFPEPTGPAPGEGRCNFARRSTALVDHLLGVVQFGDVVVEIRQDGETETTAQMEALTQLLRPR